MLADQEVAEIAGGADLGQHIPGNTDRQADGHPRDPGHRLPGVGDLALPERPERDRAAHVHQDDGALGEHAEPRRNEKGVPPRTPPPLGQRVAADHRLVECQPHRGDRQIQTRIGHHGAGGHEEKHRGRQQRGCQPRRDPRSGVLRSARPAIVLEQGARPDEAQGENAQRAEEGRQAQGELIDAQQPDRDRAQPDIQGRLGPERYARDLLRRDVIAGDQHHAGNFAVPRLGSIHQRVRAERGQPHREDAEDHQSQDPPYPPAAGLYIRHGNIRHRGKREHRRLEPPAAGCPAARHHTGRVIAAGCEPRTDGPSRRC